MRRTWMIAAVLYAAALPFAYAHAQQERAALSAAAGLERGAALDAGRHARGSR